MLTLENLNKYRSKYFELWRKSERVKRGHKILISVRDFLRRNMRYHGNELVFRAESRKIISGELDYPDFRLFKEDDPGFLNYRAYLESLQDVEKLEKVLKDDVSSITRSILEFKTKNKEKKGGLVYFL